MKKKNEKNTYLLDTNIASSYSDENFPYHEHSRSFLESNLDEGFHTISIIALAEIEYGKKLLTGKDSNKQRKIEIVIDKIMENFPMVWEIDRETTEYYSSIRAGMFQNHAIKDKNGKIKSKYPEDLVENFIASTPGKKIGIQENDLWLVSISVRNNLVLITNDKKMDPIFEKAKKVDPKFRVIIWDIEEAKKTIKDNRRK